MHNTCWNVFIVNKEKEIQALSGSRAGGIGLISYLNVNKYDIISPYKITPKPINEKDDSNGYIYILTNRYMPGLLKIGKTVHPPKKRARDISRGINIPWEFELVYSKKVENCSLCERKIHDALDNYRYNPDREFFMITLDKALDVIESIT